jgi:molybdenum cofactor cytidylyltransferase
MPRTEQHRTHYFAVVPAAGESRRMSRPKLLLPWEGRPLLDHVLAAWKRSQVDEIVVVVRPGDEAVQTLAEAAGCHVAIPPAATSDMRASILCGLEWLKERFAPRSGDAWLVAPADMPGLSWQVINRLVLEHARSGDMPLVPFIGQRRAHPVLFPWSWKPLVEQLRAGQGISALLAAEAVQAIECSDLVAHLSLLDDIDTPEDYERMKERPTTDENDR